jgi:CDP-diacylglycerol---glycerol-3-phosphate 3-phosphatidyltransferase
MLKKEYINIANILTFSRIVCGVLFLILFLNIQNLKSDHILSLILQIVSFLVFTYAIVSDGLDGYFARRNSIVSDFGKHFDPLSDSIFFIIVFFTFLVIGLMPWYLFVLIVLREGFMTIFLRPYVKSKGSILPASIFGKIKTVFQCIFSFIILTALIFKEILDIFSIKISFLMFSIQICSLIFFSIIVFLSISSLFIYIFNLKNILSQKITK